MRDSHTPNFSDLALNQKKHWSSALQRLLECCHVTADLGKNRFQEKGRWFTCFFIDHSRFVCLRLKQTNVWWMDPHKCCLTDFYRCIYQHVLTFFEPFPAMAGKITRFCILCVLKEGKMAEMPTNHHLLDKLAAKNQEENDIHNHNKDSHSHSTTMTKQHPRDRLRPSEWSLESSGKP